MSEAQSSTDGLCVDLPRLAGATALSENGEVVSIGSLWAEQAALLVFVRHFG